MEIKPASSNARGYARPVATLCQGRRSRFIGRRYPTATSQSAHLSGTACIGDRDRSVLPRGYRARGAKRRSHASVADLSGARGEDARLNGRGAAIRIGLLLSDNTRIGPTAAWSRLVKCRAARWALKSICKASRAVQEGSRTIPCEEGIFSEHNAREALLTHPQTKAALLALCSDVIGRDGLQAGAIDSPLPPLGWTTHSVQAIISWRRQVC